VNFRPAGHQTLFSASQTPLEYFLFSFSILDSI
jgi:hypothetical protein